MNDLITERAGDFFLQFFDLVRVKFDDLATVHIDDMVMMGATRLFKTRRPASKSMTMNCAALFQQLHCPIDSRKRNAGIDLDRAPKNLKRIRMVFRFGQNIENDAAWPCNSDPSLP